MADARSSDCAVMPKVGNKVLKLRHSLFYFHRVGKTVRTPTISFRESTNLVAALLRASGMSSPAELAPLSPIGIGDFLFDPLAFRGCVNRLVEMELNG